jgi:SAM-dependent methyltransferase
MTHSFDESYWEQVWRNGRAAAMRSAPTNPHLVREVADLTPGTVLDAGCGGGAEAIWLAEHGWQVTAADVAHAALAVAADRAAAKGVTERVRWVRADLSTWVPDADYDLVTTHYAHPAMPQLEFYDRLASWVTPGGTLFVVGHLHHDFHGHSDGPPVEASVTAADITARLDPGGWEIATARETHRSVPGADGRTTSLHDVVVRARRRP